MPGPQNIPSAIVRHLPKTLTAYNGDSFTIDWLDAAELVTYPDAPFGTFYIMPMAPEGPAARHGGIRYDAVSTSDVHAYSDGTITYPFSEDPIHINSVVGTLLGNAGHTFVPGVDYVTGHTVGKDFVPTYIKWLSGGDKPDDATNFTVTYDYPDVVTSQVSRGKITVRLTLYVSALDNGENGASQYWPKSRLAVALGDDLFAQLRAIQGANMISGTTGELTAGPVAPLGIMDIDPADTLARYTCDLRLRRLHIHETVERRTASVTDINFDATGTTSGPFYTDSEGVTYDSP